MPQVGPVFFFAGRGPPAFDVVENVLRAGHPFFDTPHNQQVVENVGNGSPVFHRVDPIRGSGQVKSATAGSNRLANHVATSPAVPMRANYTPRARGHKPPPGSIDSAGAGHVTGPCPRPDRWRVSPTRQRRNRAKHDASGGRGPPSIIFRSFMVSPVFHLSRDAHPAPILPFVVTVHGPAGNSDGGWWIH